MTPDSWGDALARAANLPPEGGRIELPDGTVIEVRPMDEERSMTYELVVRVTCKNAGAHMDESEELRRQLLVAAVDDGLESIRRLPYVLELDVA